MIFTKDLLVCSQCMIYDGFFRGGGSWAPDSCPKCGGTDCTLFQNLNFLQKRKARRLNIKLWEKHYGKANE